MGSRWGVRVRRLSRNRASVAACTLIAGLMLLAAAADVLAPQPFAVQHPGSINASPGGRFPLGTDQLGRDILSRLLYGARISLAVGILSQIVVLVVGVPVAL